METKHEIIEAIRNMAKSEEFNPAFLKEAVKLKKQFEAIKEAQIAEDKKTYLEDGGELIYWEPKKDEEDAKFNEAWNLYAEARDAYREKKANEEKKNYDEKKALLVELQDLTKEENIGRAFQKFNLIRDKWKELGHVASEVHKELQDEYGRLLDQFYYQIRIFKELQEHDLKKHYDEKKELIEKIRGLLSEKRIKDVEMYLKAYETDWVHIGPTFQDKWEEVRQEYRDVTHEVYQKIKAHYQALREKQNAALAEKQAIIEEAKAIFGQIEANTPKSWEELTQQAQSLQEKWKATAKPAKDKAEQAWEEFKTVLDSFYEAKKEFFKHRRDELGKIREQKLKIIAEAESLKESELWKQTSARLIELQKQWKNAGSITQREEQKLWGKFRAACDQFFTRKKHFYDNIDVLQAENQKLKEQLLEQIAAFVLSGNKQQDITQLKAFQHEWNQIGLVPRAEKDRLNNAFQSAINQHFETLDLKKKEKLTIQFESRIEKLQEAENSNDLLKREKRGLQDELKKLEAEILNYENNMAFFKHAKDNNPLKLEAEKKLKLLKERMESLQLKKRMLDKA